MMNKIKALIYKVLKVCLVKPLSKRGFGRIGWIAAIYRFIVGGLTTIQEKVVDINGYKLHVRRGKWGIGGIAKCLIYDGEYEPHTTEIFRELIKPDMQVVDVGANIGYYTVFASKLVGKGGWVWAFEPEPINYSSLMENIQLNQLDNVMAMKKAVSDFNGVTKLNISKLEAGAHSLISEAVKDRSEVIDVEVIRLDDAIKGRVDFIKTDTEGNELAVLRGARRLLRDQDIRLVVEFYPRGFGLAGYTIESLWDLLLDCGFRHMYLLDEGEHKTIPTNTEKIQRHVKRYGFSVNVLCLKRPIEEL